MLSASRKHAERHLASTVYIRKTLAWCLLGVVATACSILPHRGGSNAPTATIAEDSLAGAVPSRFLGFSIETSNLCYVIELAKTDPAFVQLFLNFRPGVLRVGGDTGDRFASWSPTAGQPTCSWNHMVVTPSLVKAFFQFAQSVGYRVMWQVPLDNSDPSGDAAEAAYVSRMPDLYSIEIGNEPNIYPHCTQDYQTYINDWGNVYRRYRADGGTAPVTGPATTALNKCYAVHFLKQDASRIKAFTVHHYVAGASTKPTCKSLLKTTVLSIAVKTAVKAGKTYGLPAIMNETNTYSQHGMPGVSNAFCSALWAANYTLLGQLDGLQGIYFHGTANDATDNWQGKLAYITPINDRGTPAPEYYGLLFYHQVAKAGGHQLKTTESHVSQYVNIYAVMGSDRDLRVAVINRGGTPATLSIETTHSYTGASKITLTAPSLGALSGVTLGSTTVAANGTWAPDPQPVTIHGTSCAVTVPAYTGVIFTYPPAS